MPIAVALLCAFSALPNASANTVAAGQEHSLYVTTAGDLYAMGNNGSGQLGDGTTTNRSTPFKVASGVVSVAAGDMYSLYVTAAGDLYTMGNNYFGQLGDGTTTNRSTPVKVASGVRSVAAGFVHCFYVTEEGDLYAMGYNSYGQLGDGTTTSRSRPVKVASGVVSITSGGQHSLYVTEAGDLYAMGWNSVGQLGDGTTTNRSRPVKVASSVVSVTAGNRHSLYVTATGDLYAMGYNGYGQLGDGATTNRSTPVKVVSGVFSVTAGIDHSLYVTAAGDLYAMGLNDYGQLGDWTTTNRSTAVKVASGVVSVTAGNRHSIYVTAAGDLYAMGSNGYGQLGDRTAETQSTPVKVAAGVVIVAAGMQHSLYVTANGDLYAMGYNGSGQLGGGTTGGNALVKVASGVVSVTAGNHHSLYVTAAGDLYVMGYNVFGQLGEGTTTNRSTPVKVASGVRSVAAGEGHSLYVTAVGDLYAMGNNSYGQLGDGTATNRSTPVKVASGVVSVAAGGNYSRYVTAAGDLFAMGSDSSAQLGNGTPVKVASGVVSVAAGGSGHSLYVTAAGDLFAMGINYDGQLGDGTTTNRSTPVKVASGVTSVTAGLSHSFYVTAAGDLYAMGNNGSGQLGDGTTTDRSTPVKVDSGVVSVTAGIYHSLYVTATGDLYAMGYNRYGQLGGGVICFPKKTATQVNVYASDQPSLAAIPVKAREAAFTFMPGYEFQLGVSLFYSVYAPAYQWYKNGVAIPGATGRTLTASLASGSASYYAELTIKGQTYRSETRKVSVVSPQIYVSAKGDDGNDGAFPATAKRSLEAALASPIPYGGLTIYVTNEGAATGGVSVFTVLSKLIIPKGVTIEFQPGTVVKFATGAGFQVETGGTLKANGAVFTPIADDSIGGDTQGDGSQRLPQYDSYTVDGTGQIVFSADSTLRYQTIKVEKSGTLSSDQTWLGNTVYKITGDLTVPSGKTLTIQPGAIVKFDAGKRLTVSSGGTLIANGTADNKIVFTSIKDDSHGGDTNGNGSNSAPNMGDWIDITVTGTLQMRYAQILYSGDSTSSGNSASDAGSLRFVNGGTGTVDSCLIAYSQFDAIQGRSTGSNATITNTIIFDCDRFVNLYPGSPNITFIDCILNGASTRTDYAVSTWGGPLTLKNCVVSNVAGNFTRGSVSYSNCVLWNPPGSGQQNYRPSGNNLWVDPLFRDPANGDFTLRAGSPCIDAGDGTAAPARDYFGRERADDLHAANTGKPSANGACPDIGVYEMTANAVSEVDLVIESLTAPVSAQVGTNITVSHTIANIGSKSATGNCTSDLWWVNATGGATVKAGTTTTALALAPGGQVVVSQTIAVSALADGDWRLRVQVNVNRAISEGQNTGNNTRDAANLTAITMPALTGRTEDFTVGAGRERSFKVEASASADNVVLIQAVAGLKIYGGHGYVPSGGGHDSTAVYVGNGLYALTLPQGSGAVYVTLENASTTAQVLTIEQTAATLRLYGASVSQMPKTGQTTFSLYGTGFKENTAVSLKQGGVVLTPASVRLVSASELVVTVTTQDAVAGTYDIVASGGGASATLPGALTVPGTPPMGPKLEAKLEVPDAIRAGRINTGWISYANTGDTDMHMPLFTIKASAQTQMIDRLDGEFGNEPVYLAGVSGSYPAGVLKAGESGRVSFFFKVVGDGAAQFTLTHSQEGDGAAPYPEFSSRRDYFESLSAAATRFAQLGRVEARINKLTDYELTRRAGIPIAGIAGTVRSSQNKEAMAGVTVFVVRGGETVRSAVTDENGFFLLEQLADGAYSLIVDGASLVSAPGVLTVAGQKDVGGTVITAAPWRSVSGRVRVAVTGTGVSGIPVKLVEKGGWTGKAVTDASGGFLFQNVVEGTYDVIAESAGGYVGDSVSAVTLTEGSFSQNVELEMTPGGIVTGVVTWNGGQANEGRVSAILADGRTVETACAEDGSYSFGGLPEATYTFQYAADEWLSGETAVTVTKGGTQVVNLDAKPRPLFFPERPLGFGSLTTNFRFADTKRRDSVQTWKWDFDSDGTIDSTEIYPAHTYSRTGSYTVTLEITEAEGTTTASRYENCVTVMEPIPNVINANAFIVSDMPGLACMELTDTGLVLEGTPPLTITQGTVIMAEKDGATVIRKVKAVVQNGDLWSLETEDADFDALYESYSFSSFGETTEVVSPAPLTRSIARAAAATSTSGPITVKGGLIGSIEARPKLRPDFVSWKRNGVSYMRIAVIADIEAEITLGINGEISGGFEKTYEMKLAFPTTVPGLTIGPKFEYGFEGSLTGSAKATLCTYTMNPTVVMGIERINGKTKPLKSPPKFAGTLQGPEGSLGLNGSVKGFFKIQAETEWCKLVRASLGAELSDEISIETKTNTPLKIENKVELAITAELGVGLDINNFELLGPRATFELPWTLANNKWESPMPVIDYLPSSSTNYANGGWVAPATINFKDKSAPGSNTTSVSFLGSSRVTYPIEEYKWDLGILSSPLKDPQCTYTKDGAYKVTLKVKGGPITSMLSTAEHAIQVGKKKEPPKPDKHDDDKKSDQKRSQDPNEMAGPAGVGALRYVQPGEWLSFRVYFENKSDAAAAAQEVWVTNMLSSSLDWGSFELQEVVFANQVELGLNGKKTGSIEVAQRGTSTRVRVEASLDALTGKVVWYMRSVDPASADSWPADPYAGFLAPNNETGRGEGYVAYRVKVRADAPHGTRIDSSAEIIFDYNDPIITNPAWFNTVSEAPVFTTQPQAQSVTVGVNVTFTAIASGYPMPTYQWYKDGVALSGQTNSTLTLTKVQVGNTGSYTVRATNAVAPSGISSNAATLTVNAPQSFVITVQPTSTTATLNPQTGLFQLTINVTNTTPLPINGFRLHVNYQTYQTQYPSLRLYNATSPSGSPDVYVDYPYPLAVNGMVPVDLEFYTRSRTFPDPLAPVLTVETLASSAVSTTNGSGVQPLCAKLANGTVRLEFTSVTGHWYRIRYSADLVNWFDCQVPIQAGGTRMQWIDTGAPLTNISPADPSVTSRFYLVNEITAP